MENEKRNERRNDDEITAKRKMKSARITENPIELQPSRDVREYDVLYGFTVTVQIKMDIQIGFYILFIYSFKRKYRN
jgi:hypothetical protein